MAGVCSHIASALVLQALVLRESVGRAVFLKYYSEALEGCKLRTTPSCLKVVRMFAMSAAVVLKGFPEFGFRPGTGLTLPSTIDLMGR